MTGMKAILGLGILSTTGIIAQTMPQVPEDFKTWPATAILGVITLASLGVNYFVFRKLFDAIGTLDKTANTVQELCARMNVRPCIANTEK